MKNILIVDDSPLIRASLERVIHLSGLQPEKVLQASGGEEALQLLESQAMDLVITDIHMPGMGGLELLERMRQEERWKHIPAVVVTSDTGSSIEEYCGKLGVTAILKKPFHPERFRDILAACMGGRQSE